MDCWRAAPWPRILSAPRSIEGVRAEAVDRFGWEDNELAIAKCLRRSSSQRDLGEWGRPGSLACSSSQVGAFAWDLEVVDFQFVGTHYQLNHPTLALDAFLDPLGFQHAIVSCPCGLLDGLHQGLQPLADRRLIGTRTRRETFEHETLRDRLELVRRLRARSSHALYPRRGVRAHAARKPT